MNKITEKMEEKELSPEEDIGEVEVGKIWTLSELLVRKYFYFYLVLVSVRYLGHSNQYEFINIHLLRTESLFAYLHMVTW